MALSRLVLESHVGRSADEGSPLRGRYPMEPEEDFFGNLLEDRRFGNEQIS